MSLVRIPNAKTYQKAMNLYLYCCPSSAQPLSILYGLIYGTLHRYFWQNSHRTDFESFTKKFFQRLIDQAHLKKDLEPLFNKALTKVKRLALPNPRPGLEDNNNNMDSYQVYIHLPYHPQNPSQEAQNSHRLELFDSLRRCEPDLCTRIIVALSRAPNIGDLCKKNRLEKDINTSLSILDV